MGKILNITIIVLILGALVYAYMSFTGAEPEPQGFFAPGSEGALPAEDPGSTTGGVAPGDDFVALLIDLQQIKLDTAFFTSALYASLKDFSRELTPVTPGRANPFAPIGVGGTPVRTQRATVGASVDPVLPTVVEVPLPPDDPGFPDDLFLDEGF